MKYLQCLSSLSMFWYFYLLWCFTYLYYLPGSCWHLNETPKYDTFALPTRSFLHGYMLKILSSVTSPPLFLFFTQEGKRDIETQWTSSKWAFSAQALLTFWAENSLLWWFWGVGTLCIVRWWQHPWSLPVDVSSTPTWWLQMYPGGPICPQLRTTILNLRLPCGYDFHICYLIGTQLVKLIVRWSRWSEFRNLMLSRISLEFKAGSLITQGGT